MKPNTDRAPDETARRILRRLFLLRNTTILGAGLGIFIARSIYSLTLLLPPLLLTLGLLALLNLLTWLRLHTRFSVVNSELFIQLLLDVAAEESNVLENPSPTVRLKEFGSSSLNFELVFWTSKLMHRQGLMKSMINLAVNKKLAENNISVPFPQLDLHVKNMPEKDSK